MKTKVWHIFASKIRYPLWIIMALACCGFSSSTSVWNRIGQGIYESDIRTMLIDPRDNNNVYVGTSKALYRSSDRGGVYEVLLRPSGKQGGVNNIFIAMDEPETIYAATDSGLYETQNNGETWNRIYHASDAASQKCFSVIRFDLTIYLGTQGGLYQKKMQEVNWRKKNGNINDKPIYQLVEDERFMYGVTGQTMYRLNKQSKRIQKIFSIGIGENHSKNDIAEEDSVTNEDRFIKFINISTTKQHVMSVATSKGIYVSFDQGKEWRSLPTNNVAVEGMTSLVILENNTPKNQDCLQASLGCLRFVVGTNKGVFFLEKERWMPLYKGIETNKISYLTKNERGTVYAATARGIYFLSDERTLPNLNNSDNNQKAGLSETQTDLGSRFWSEHEPSINEVHQLAINYAEVNYEKIASWRVLARRKALMPDLSVGLDRAASDLFHWNTGASPDELQKGRDFIDWDVSLSWDLADLVWSTDQTTIDSRSKLMVELREDILDEVTRLYFERRRIQVEMISNNASDGQWIVDKEMRIAELTALIDALTGGEFSQRILRGNGKKAVSRQSSDFSHKGY